MYGKDKKNKFDQALKRLVEDAYWNSDMEDDWVEDWEDKPEYNQKVKQCLQKLVASRQKNLDKFLNVKSFCAKNLPKLESHLDTVASLEAVYWGEAERLNTLKAELIVGLDQMRSKLDSSPDLWSTITEKTSTSKILNNASDTLNRILQHFKDISQTKSISQLNRIREELQYQFKSATGSQVVIGLSLVTGGAAYALASVMSQTQNIVNAVDEAMDKDAGHAHRSIFDMLSKGTVNSGLSNELNKRYSTLLDLFINGYIGLKMAELALKSVKLNKKGMLSEAVQVTTMRLQLAYSISDKAINYGLKFYDDKIEKLREFVKGKKHLKFPESEIRTPSYPFYKVLRSFLKYHQDYKSQNDDAIVKAYKAFPKGKEDFFSHEVTFLDKHFTILHFATRIPVFSFNSIDATIGAGIDIYFDVNAGASVKVKNIFHDDFNLSKDVIHVDAHISGEFGITGFFSVGVRFAHLFNVEAHVDLSFTVTADLRADFGLVVAENSPIFKSSLKNELKMSLDGNLTLEVNLGAIARIVTTVLGMKGALSCNIASCNLASFKVEAKANSSINLDSSIMDFSQLRTVFREFMNSADTHTTATSGIKDKINDKMPYVATAAEQLKELLSKKKNQDIDEVLKLSKYKKARLEKEYGIKIPMAKTTIDLKKQLQARLDDLEKQAEVRRQEIKEQMNDARIDMKMNAKQKLASDPSVKTVFDADKSKTA